MISYDQNFHRIKQRKGLCFIEKNSVDKDDQDDEYDSEIFHDRMHKICVALNKEKDVGLTQALSDDEDDQDDDHDSRVSPDFNAQKLHRINQRKGLCFIQASSDDKDDKDDDLITSMNS